MHGVRERGAQEHDVQRHDEEAHGKLVCDGHIDQLCSRLVLGTSFCCQGISSLKSCEKDLVCLSRQGVRTHPHGHGRVLVHDDTGQVQSHGLCGEARRSREQNGEDSHS